ncbi:MAG TPA: hypothetical protein ENK60_02835 [Anaerolineae bacterium]|nr:hypothetical protein [Anaerolineae bacterium]
MSIKSNYTPEEWNLLGVAPFLAGTTVMRVGSSGIRSIKEAVAVFKGILEGAESYPDSELVRTLSDKDEASKAEDRFGPLIKGMNAQEVKDFTLKQLQEVRHILDTKTPEEDAKAYKQWIMDICLRVAKAAKEGGHFGFGGVQISDPEKEALRDIASALGVEPPSEANA